MSSSTEMAPLNGRPGPSPKWNTRPAGGAVALAWSLGWGVPQSWGYPKMDGWFTMENAIVRIG